MRGFDKSNNSNSSLITLKISFLNIKWLPNVKIGRTRIFGELENYLHTVISFLFLMESWRWTFLVLEVIKLSPNSKEFNTVKRKINKNLKY